MKQMLLTWSAGSRLLFFNTELRRTARGAMVTLPWCRAKQGRVSPGGRAAEHVARVVVLGTLQPAPLGINGCTIKLGLAEAAVDIVVEAAEPLGECGAAVDLGRVGLHELAEVVRALTAGVYTSEDVNKGVEVFALLLRGPLRQL